MNERAIESAISANVVIHRVLSSQIARKTHHSAAHNCTTLFQDDAALWQFGFGFYQRHKYSGFTKPPTDLYYRAFYVYSLYLLAKANQLTGCCPFAALFP